MEFRQLLPAPETVDVDALLDSLAPTEHAPAQRPHTAVNFIASADGHATFGGRSGQLGDDGDRAMFHGLRERFDAVLAGTGTLRTERYGRILANEARRRRRVEQGLGAEPLACIITRGGSIPDDIPLLAEPEARVVVLSPVEVRGSAWRARVEHVRLQPGDRLISSALGELRARYGVRSLLCEGGPTLFGAMLKERVVDELFLTVAPKLAGGGAGPPVTSGPGLPEPARMRLLWLLERRHSLYLRYALAASGREMGQ